ncbi:hypothetical protein Pcinc_026305 [Petrolisthes cinctipes]|uniref:SHSP domain-containing protein n=1 Tax=Petrolisthes cinctipes TaxID=88211 RepID=A0AAE1F6X8_PETCI|nr:hypothetical protein Pcinc_026305 [Petrolisthes cinctipes]
MDRFMLIPVKPWDFSVIDQEFNSGRDNFRAEMKRMEDEMSRFHRECSIFDHPMLMSAEKPDKPETPTQTFGSWLEGMKSPLIKDEGDNKQLKFRFDVSQYKPDEIEVKAQDNSLMVHAKHEEKSEGRSVHNEYKREILLPKGTNPEHIKSSLSKDGVLTVEAPLPAIDATGERLIPIKQN